MVFRVLVLLSVLHGLVPGLGEVVESVVHLATAGHLAHTPGEEDLGEQGPEHSCGTTLHTCGCCATQPVAPSGRFVIAGDVRRDERRPGRDARLVVQLESARPFRPPIV